MDPIEKVVDWQLRSLDVSNLKEAASDLKRPWTFEEKLIDALDLKYLFNRLPYKHRKIMQLQWFGYTQREIASIMDVSQGTISNWFNQIREKVI